MQIQAHTAIVTGGSSGLGAATAKTLSQKGAKVTIFDLNEGLGKKVAKELNGRFIPVDVADESSVADALKQTITDFGIPRILVNCAGILSASRTVGKIGPFNLDTFKQVINVNLIGTFNCIRLIAAEMQNLEPMEDDERGVIINTASVAAYDGQIGQAAYSASKAGIVGMTLPIARDLAGLGIRNVSIAPGIFKTAMMATLPDDVQASLGASVPFPKRLGHPQEFADLVCHICENKMLNGETIRLDGSIRMGPK